ncbi:MAG: T9SS type A sorting domain-containing protein [Cytophagales bacterium]
MNNSHACLSGTTVNVGGAGCQAFSVSGQINPCVNNIENYVVNFSQYSQITWTVSPSKGRIVAINGVNIQNALSQNNLPANNMYGVIISTNYRAITFNVDVFIQGDTFKAGGAIDLSFIPGLRNLFTDFTGQSIVVQWYKPGDANVVASASSVSSNSVGNLVTCYSQTSDSRSVFIKGADMFDNSLVINQSQSTVTCNTGLTVALNKWVDNAQYSWNFTGPGQILYSPGNNNQVWINGFTIVGQYTINLDMRDICGNFRRLSRTINVTSPDFELRVGGQVNANPILNCSQVDFGFEVSAEPWISSSATYTWELPAGWEIANRTPQQTQVVNGMEKLTYSGVNLRYATVRRRVSEAQNGILIVRLQQCGSILSKQIALNNPSNILWNVPSRITSCQSEFDFTANISGGTPPYRFTWRTLTAGTTLQNAETTVPQNSFKANSYGSHRFQLSVSDANNCGISRPVEVFVTGAVNNGQENQISGWLSGRVEPANRRTISSNFAWDNDNNRLYFVDSERRNIRFYSFVNNSWRPTEVQIQTGNFSGDVPLFFFKTGNNQNLLFHLDGNRLVNYSSIDPSTGDRSNNIPIRIVNNVVTSGDFFSFKVIQETETLFRLIWKESNGSLKSQILEYTANGTLNPIGAPFTLFTSSVSGFAISALRYEVDVKNKKIFYFLSNGGFYYLKYDDLEAGNINPILINNLNQWNTQPDQVTSVDFDSDGNVYYAANGDVYFAEFTSNNNLAGFYKIETTEAVGLDFPSQATGNFTINTNSNVIYYIGSNNNVYQLYRKPNFESNKTFGVVKATPYLFSDFASQHPIFVSNSGGTHLFYRNTSSDLSDLSYTEALIACRPRWVREEEAQNEVSGKELGELKTVNLTSSIKNTDWLVYPNPAKDILFVKPLVSLHKAISFQIQDNFGAEKQTFSSNNWVEEGIDISHLSAGIYIIKITNELGVSNAYKFAVTK